MYVIAYVIASEKLIRIGQGEVLVCLPQSC